MEPNVKKAVRKPGTAPHTMSKMNIIQKAIKNGITI